MVAQIRLAIRYILNLGLSEGFRLFWAVEIRKAEKIMVKGWDHPVHMRRDTSDASVFREVFLFNIYKFDSDPLKVIVDGGSNIGLSSIFFKRAFPEALIISIEPETSNYNLLKQNIGHVRGVSLFNTGLWHSECNLKVKDGATHWMKEVVEVAKDDPNSFKAISINMLIQKFSLEKIDLVKLDVESAEREIFSSNIQWIARTKYIVLELHDWMKPGCSNAFYRAISSFNVQTRIVGGMLLIENLDVK